MDLAVLKNLLDINGNVTSKIIKDLISEHGTQRDKMIRLYNSYQGEVPIFNRTFDNSNKINNKLANDYRGQIIDQVTGYMFGKPITFQVDNEPYNEATYKIIKNTLYEFNTKNNIDDLDSTTGKFTSICGYSARLLYIDTNGKERVINLPPWEVIIIIDGSTAETQYALRYYPVMIQEDNKMVSRTKVEWYDNKNITFYIQDRNGNYILDTTELKNPIKHMFDYVPVVKFKNNDEEQGDFEKVENLIDSYDRLVSDCQNEIEEFRLAYLLFYGVEIDEDTIKAARRSGAFGGLDAKDGGKVEFLTKDVNDTFLESHKKTLDKNIFKFTSTVDMSDESFSGGTMSGESRKWKIKALEDKAITKERKFSAAIREQFKILCSSWNKKSIPANYLDFYWDFKRNIPVDLLYEADVQDKLMGKVSDKTRLSLFSPVDDPDWEIEQMRIEQENYVNLDKVVDSNA